ncbi:hypothetical protein [Bacillus methanolicus]|uniref:hypothetical protein n=1 Tax=Bacillus methanolicus TaxID=1471 RepID=UPI0023807014|nr:hypothetical protein [Bacillus methanolicus]
MKGQKKAICHYSRQCCNWQTTNMCKSTILPETKQLPPTVIGSGVTIGTSAIIYANTEIGDEVFIADLAAIHERVIIGEKNHCWSRRGH